MSERDDRAVTTPSPQDEASTDRRRVLKLSILGFSALVANQVYERPRIAAAAVTQGQQLSGAAGVPYQFQRQLPSTWFPGTISHSDAACSPSVYNFTGTIQATAFGTTFRIDSVDLTGHYVSGEDIGTPLITNSGSLSGNIDGAGNFSTMGTLTYADGLNPSPVSVGVASLAGQALSPSVLHHLILQCSPTIACLGAAANVSPVQTCW